MLFSAMYITKKTFSPPCDSFSQSPSHLVLSDDIEKSNIQCVHYMYKKGWKELKRERVNTKYLKKEWIYVGFYVVLCQSL